MADYYNSQFSGKEVDDAIEKIRSIIANPSESATLDLDKYLEPLTSTLFTKLKQLYQV